MPSIAQPLGTAGREQGGSGLGSKGGETEIPPGASPHPRGMERKKERKMGILWRRLLGKPGHGRREGKGTETDMRTFPPAVRCCG